MKTTKIHKMQFQTPNKNKNQITSLIKTNNNKNKPKNSKMLKQRGRYL